MRELTPELTTKQETGRSPRILISLDYGGDVLTYTNKQVIRCSHTEEDDTSSALILLDNSDKSFNNLDPRAYRTIIFNGAYTGITRTAWVANTAYSLGAVVIPTTKNGLQYICIDAGTSHAVTEPTWPTTGKVADNDIVWMYYGNEGDEYSETAPLWLTTPQFNSSRSGLSVYLFAIGTMNWLGQDLAMSDYDNTGSNLTAKGLINKILSGGTGDLACYSLCGGLTAVWEASTAADPQIDNYRPDADFRIAEGDSRLDRIKWLLSHSGCVMRPQAGGTVHFLVPEDSGAVYDYEYALPRGNHPFFDKTYRNSLIVPNRIVVKSSDLQGFEGEETDDESYSRRPTSKSYKMVVDGVAQAYDIAAAIIRRKQLDAERGTAVVPMNCGAEVWDYIIARDTREGTTAVPTERTGSIQHLVREWDIQKGTWSMTFSFGKPGSMPALGVMSIGVPGTITTDQLWQLFVQQQANIDAIAAYLTGLNDPLSPPADIPDPLYLNWAYLRQGVGFYGESGLLAYFNTYGDPSTLQLVLALASKLQITMDAGDAIIPAIDKNGMLGDTTHAWEKGYIDKAYMTTRAVAPVGADMYDV